jgi:hypothetical protein
MASPLDLEQLGVDLDAAGFAGREAAVHHVVRLARAYGVGGAATGVLGDTTAPEIARLRAYSIVAAALRPSVDRRPARTMTAVA